MPGPVTPIGNFKRTGLGPQDGIGVQNRLEMIEFTLPLNTATLAVFEMPPGYDGRILEIAVQFEVITTDTDADATVQARRMVTDGTWQNTTGGLITLTDDAGGGEGDAGEEGVYAGGTQITGNNAFAANDVIGFLYTVTNAFADGQARVVMILEAYGGGA